MKIVLLLALAIGSVVVVVAEGEMAPPVFTAQQAEAGKTAYAKNCASCHMPDLSGNAEIPPLAGATFIGTWSNRTTKDLRDYMSAAMPYGAPSLDADSYTAISAYILQSNGAVAGEDKLTPETAVPIKSLTTKKGS